MTDTTEALRRSDLIGRTIVQVAEANPRHEGTQGYQSFEILKTAGGRMKYEDYLAAGGRTQDLRWDLDHGYVRMAGMKLKPAFLIAR